MLQPAMSAAVELVEPEDELTFPWYGVITNSLVIGTNAFALFQCFPTQATWWYGWERLRL